MTLTIRFSTSSPTLAVCHGAYELQTTEFVNVPRPAQGDQLEIQGRSFVVMGVERLPDGSESLQLMMVPEEFEIAHQ